MSGMKSIFSLLLLVLVTATGCKTEKEEAALPVLDLGAVIGKQVADTFTWNGIAKRITYIPLPTSSDTLLGMAQLVHIGPKFYGMVDQKTGTIFCTDKKGKIVHAFSHRGQGPGEYNMLTYVYMNPEETAIGVFDQRSNKHILYDFEGNLIQETSLKGTETGMPLLARSDYMVLKGQMINASHKLYITGSDLTVRQRLFPGDKTLTDNERLCLTWQLNFCRNRDRAIVHYANEDTVFAISAEGMQPLCLLKKGAYRLPLEEAKKPMEITPEGSPYLLSIGLSTVSDYYLITYLRENCMYDEIWSKKNNQILSRTSNENGQWGFPLTLPSGKEVCLNPRSLYISGNTVAAFIEASAAAEGQVPNVHEDDNPVLVVMEI